MKNETSCLLLLLLLLLLQLLLLLLHSPGPQASLQETFRSSQLAVVAAVVLVAEVGSLTQAGVAAHV